MGCARSKNMKSKNSVSRKGTITERKSHQHSLSSPEEMKPTDLKEDLSEQTITVKSHPRLSIIDDDDKLVVQPASHVNNIEKLYEHKDETGNSTSILRTSYVQEHKFNPEETVTLLRKEAFSILQKEINRQRSLDDAIKLLNSSLITSAVRNDLLEHAVILIRSGEINSIEDLTDRLNEKRLFAREEVDACIKALFMFSEDRATKSSLLKVLHEKLEKGNNILQARPTAAIATGFALEDLQLDAKEHENVEVMVKKSVKRRSITRKDLEQRGIRFEDVKGKDIFFVSNAPEGLDERVRAKAEQLMTAAGSIYNCNAHLTHPSKDGKEAIEEITKIMEAHKNFCSDLEKNVFDDNKPARNEDINCVLNETED